MALKQVFCVQAYGRKGDQLRHWQFRQFGSSEEALEAGEAMFSRAAGVVVFSVEGEPDFDYWGDPRVLATHGDVPLRLQCG